MIRNRHFTPQFHHTFDKEVGKRRAIGNELRLDPFGFNRVSSLRIWTWSTRARKRTLYSRRGKKNGEIPHGWGGCVGRLSEGERTTAQADKPPTALGHLYTLRV